MALRNGTVGWTLEGFELEHSKIERVRQPSHEASLKAREYAAAWAQHVGVQIINGDQLSQLLAKAKTRTLYMLDVRDPDEYALLRARIEELVSSFGALPVHHSLWDSATETAYDLRARISIIALVHEARGLDVNPMTIQKFRNAGDAESVKSLEVIHNDEITHVTTGHRWLTWICAQEGTDPVQVFRSNVQKHFRGPIRGAIQ